MITLRVMINPTNYLKEKGIDIFRNGLNSYKLTNEPYMDLTVETWLQNGNAVVSMCHYGEMNGDLMKDPDILFMVNKSGDIEYKEFQNDYTGFYSEDHKEIKDFMENTWINNLIMQGHELTKEEHED